MKLRFAIVISVLLVGCATPRHSDAPAPIAPTAPQASRSIESFRFIRPETTMQQVTAKVGAPDRDVGSGLYVYAYRLSDGTNVLIGSADGLHILYVRHGTEVLFEKK
jgi:hypothetical protein